MNKQQFIEVLTSHAHAYFSDRERTPASWWLSVEELAKTEFSREYRKEVGQPTQK